MTTHANSFLAPITLKPAKAFEIIDARGTSLGMFYEVGRWHNLLELRRCGNDEEIVLVTDAREAGTYRSVLADLLGTDRQAFVVSATQSIADSLAARVGEMDAWPS